jgi:hypothetical protein
MKAGNMEADKYRVKNRLRVPHPVQVNRRGTDLEEHLQAELDLA